MDDQRVDRTGGKSMSAPGGRRRFSFSLRTLLILFTVLAVWLGWNAHFVQQRDAAIKYITSNGGQVFYGTAKKPWKRMPITWRILGGKPVEYIGGGGNLHDEGDREQLRALFPEVETINP